MIMMLIGALTPGTDQEERYDVSRAGVYDADTHHRLSAD